MLPVFICGKAALISLDVCLVLSFEPFLHIIHGPPGKQVCGVSAPEARLDVKHGHVSPAGWVVIRVGAGVSVAGFVLDELEKGLHVGPQPGHEASPHRRHRLFITGLQGLQQSAVVSAETGRKCFNTAAVPEKASPESELMTVFADWQGLAHYFHETE